jgi:dipeptidyl-peptidase 4
MILFARCVTILAIALTARDVAAQGSLADYQRSDNLGDLARDAVFRDRVRPEWIAGKQAFWYRVDIGPDRHEFIYVDAEAGSKAPAFDHANLAARLSPLLGREIAPDALPVDRIEFDAEGNGLRFQVETKRYRLDRLSGELVELAGDTEPPPRRSGRVPRASRRTGEEMTLTFRNATAGPLSLFWLDPEGQRVGYGVVPPGEERRQHTYAGHVFAFIDAEGKEVDRVEADSSSTFAIIDGRSTPDRAEDDVNRPRGAQSPDGKWVASVANHNIFLKSLESGEQLPLTSEGTESDEYTNRIWWSPDSSRLVVIQAKPAQEHKVHMIQSSPRDQLQPQLKTIDYLKPGDQIEHAKPRMFDIEAQRAIPIAGDLFPNPWSIDEVRWSDDSSRFTFLYNQRGHQVVRVIAVDANTGNATALIEDTSDTFIDYSQKTFLRSLDSTSELIWMSERDGWNHLYLIDSLSGSIKNQITRGDWVVREVEHIDSEHREIYFWAMGIRPDQDPYDRQLARVKFDGSELVVLTEGDGTHSAEFSPDRRFFVDTWSRVDQPPVAVLRSTHDGSLVCELERADATLAFDRGLVPPERFVAKGRDGTTDIYGIIHKPSNFDALKHYPVVEQIYAGPHDFHVPKAWSNRPGAREMAELGFIVVQIDGMGTNWRSKAFHDLCWKNLKDAGFPDRIAWIKAAAESRPRMDLSRVGIYGGSAGGQNALAALLHHGDFYKVAVADCGCHDNRMDKIWWNEAWMGWPIGPEYADNSNVTHAHKLTGKLLLIAGELDTNVDPASTMQVVNALVKADKDFDLLIIPGVGHGAAGTTYGRRRQRDFLVHHLLGVEPRWEQPPAAGTANQLPSLP